MSARPAEGEVVIALEASPINMSDLLMISGRYGYRPKLPSIVGTEGVGRVVAVGSGVTHLKEGDRTLVPYPSPAWAERIKADARLAATSARRRPAACDARHQSGDRLSAADRIRDAETGRLGDPESANSGVGRALIGIAKALGLKTVNVVRREECRRDQGDRRRRRAGRGPDLAKRVAAETGGAPIALAIDGVADTARKPARHARRQGRAGVLQRDQRQPLVRPAQPFIFRDIAIRGFWLANWFNKARPEDHRDV